MKCCCLNAETAAAAAATATTAAVALPPCCHPLAGMTPMDAITVCAAGVPPAVEVPAALTTDIIGNPNQGGKLRGAACMQWHAPPLQLGPHVPEKRASQLRLPAPCPPVSRSLPPLPPPVAAATYTLIYSPTSNTSAAVGTAMK